MYTWQLLRRWIDYDELQRGAVVVATWKLLKAYTELRTRSIDAILAELSAPQPSEVAQGPTPESSFDPRRAAWAIDVAARHLPWRSDCLVKTLAAFRWLRRHGFAPRLHLGVRKSERQPTVLEAHAWLTLGESVFMESDVNFIDQFSPIWQPTNMG
ncbi:MAG: lasso peptide biosynthesis B2 protein [Hyphomicrobiaceae bacterium]|nr:lasso peptide biosynthesis B2 protein [Hyphomicrobiaceae bacterium]